MTGKAITITANLQGRAAPSYPDFGALYETRHGMFGGGRTLWDDGEAPDPKPEAKTDPLRLTDAEWRAKRKGELADSAVDKLVEKVISLEADNRGLRTRQAPEGSTVLTSEEAKAYDAYTALGKPGDLKTELESGRAAITERDGLKRSAEISAVAETAKAKASVLTAQLDREGLSARVQGEGAKKAVHVFDKGGKDLGELRAYADKNWADYVPALFPTATTAQGVTGTVVSGQAGAGAGSENTGLAGLVAARIAERQGTTTTTGGTT